MPAAHAIDIRHLQAFVAVAEELHFGRAAQRLHMAQPPLSQLIRALEASLGAQLFTRTTRSVSITPAGELLLVRAKGILHDLDQAVEDVGRAQRGEIGIVRLGFTDLSAIELVPRIARRFKVEHPGVRLDPRGTFYSAEAVELVETEQLDAAIIHGPLVHKAMESIVLGHDYLVVALPTNHRLAQDDDVELMGLAEEPMLTYPEGRGSVIRETVMAACTGAGFRPKIVQGVQESMAIVSLVAAGFGVSLLPNSMMSFCPPGAVYRPLAGPPHKLALTLCWHAERRTAVLGRLIRTVTESVAKASSDE